MIVRTCQKHDDMTDLAFEIVEDLAELEDIKDVVSINLVCKCGSELEMGYCVNPDCDWDLPEETYPCDFCGCCPNPNKCVWSISCPICNALAKQHCHDGNKIVGLHEERWKASGTDYHQCSVAISLPLGVRYIFQSVMERG